MGYRIPPKVINHSQFMTIEQEEGNIIDPQENNEDEKEEEEKQEEVEEKKEEKKHEETPEAKRARLKRQLEQHEKKFGFKDEKKEIPETKTSEGITSKDVLFLTNEGITNEEDVEFAEKWAKFNDKPVREAIKDPTFKAILATKQEERKTSQAMQSKGGAKGSGKVSGADLLDKAKRGQYPQTEEEMERMIAAKFDAKVKKN